MNLLLLNVQCFPQICKKLSGPGKGTAEWCTNVGNELNQVLISVLTCEESVKMLKPMADGLISRFKRAEEDPPQLMYVDRGCCSNKCSTSIEALFQEWVEAGMVVRLDIFHWMNRFEAAIRTTSHPKYGLFKNAMAGAIFAYNKNDVDKIIKSFRAGNPKKFENVDDIDILKFHVKKSQLKNYARRTTLGVQETFIRVQKLIDYLKGPAGRDDDNIPLFKSDAAIDKVWASQQRHLECIQDPPGMSMYSIVKNVNLNGVILPKYKTFRGSNSLEGFHLFLPKMIPGPHCGAEAYQVHLLSGIARWNSDREAQSVFGQKGRKYRHYNTQLVNRLNERHLRLYGEVRESNFCAPIPLGDELIGLEYLFSQSSDDFNQEDYYHQIREKIQTDDEPSDVIKDSETDNNGDNDDNEEDDGYLSDVPNISYIRLTEDDDEPSLDPSIEDVCGKNHLPGFNHVEELARILVDVALIDKKRMILSQTERNDIIRAWNKLESHDKDVSQFASAYKSKWGYSYFGRTRGDPDEAAIIQKQKFYKRYAPAHLIDEGKNRLVYCVISLLWLNKNCPKTSPSKHFITDTYQRLQKIITKFDPVISNLGIPLLKINTKCISQFIRRQEMLCVKKNPHQDLPVTMRESFHVDSMQDAPNYPLSRPIPFRPKIPYEEIPSLAGTKKLKRQVDYVPMAGPSKLYQSKAGPSITTQSQNASSITSHSLPEPSSTTTSKLVPSTADPCQLFSYKQYLQQYLNYNQNTHHFN